PALPKSRSAESPKAEVCPWEVQELEAGSKAEICPWEVAAPPFEQQKAKQPPRGGPRGEKRITRQAALVSPARSLEKGGSEHEAVCPWESPGMGEPPVRPRAGSPALPTSGKSQSTESPKAEVCPWEVQELGSRDKAEICPWEVAVLPSDKDKPSQDKDGLSRASKNTSTN
ncbi:GP179 protein, partial [Anseranas semipalmata]|nr:GP179 protein [Anseranas semipalmata]